MTMESHIHSAIQLQLGCTGQKLVHLLAHRSFAANVASCSLRASPCLPVQGSRATGDLLRAARSRMTVYRRRIPSCLGLQA
jgi:hypothetical protein